MKVISKLADIDFEFGHFEYKKDHLIIHSHKDSKMQSKVYVSPNDVVSALGKAFKVPMFWAYIVFFPFFLIRYRKRHAAKRAAKK
ncbi:hypothetical protein [Paraglaciecola arctica]|jgi:hypothetical protein|uniref:Uncharacterized protein n=1 Tax=Paraglaciecola arctica BSs20135 TaxID=493475 RepID=K6XDD7_9ALTE|nr:hypothetical protein [Paraglaciecola arctica]GAC18664.1 hypothetical protein GARC_1692 [Paraglaciecola arctica BSs20135]